MSDLSEMRNSMLGVLSFSPSDEELRVAYNNRDLVSLALRWGWGDTEVREELAAFLEQARGAAGVERPSCSDG
jgi:hypothetical protein